MAATSFPRLAGICRLIDESSAIDTTVKFLTAQMASAVGLHPLEQKDFETRKLHVSYRDNVRVLHVHLGEEGKLSESSLRSSTCRAVQALHDVKSNTVEFVIPKLTTIEPARAAYVVQQAAVLKNYAFNRYITTNPKTLFQGLRIVSDGKVAGSDEQQVVLNATVFARDLANERADVANPEFLEEISKQIAAETGLGLHVLHKEDLEREGMNLFTAVGQGARYAPRLIALEHKGGPADQPFTMFVGKGITYDTGGLNIKPTGSMENMHLDMGGSAATLGAMLAIAKLKVPRNVVGILAVAENAIGKDAYKPHAIIKSHKGLTVRVNNTDAEGRLVLADALSYGQQKYQPSHIVDIATLTGACVVALGECTAGLFSNNSAIESRIKSAFVRHVGHGGPRSLLTAASTVYERVWSMPILPEHTEDIKTTPHSDLQSTGAVGKGGACTAAAFLEAFIEPARQWAHLDIAGTGMYSKDAEHFIAGGTGFGVQLLTELARDAQ